MACTRLTLVAATGLLLLVGPAARADHAHGHQTATPAAAAADPHAGHEDHSHHDVKLGTVRFATSCNAAAKPHFDRGMAFLHSFGYDEARRAFMSAAEADPTCAMPQWGIAMSWYHPIWAAPNPTELEAGRAAAAKAAELGGRTDRERAYVAAIGEYYRDEPGRTPAARAAALRVALEGLVEAYPDDHEAAIFHALLLLGTAPASDTTYAQQKQAAEILSRLLPIEPDHPGIAHYMIHSFDYPELAALALEAARVYAGIAPDSAHALHMPSHIFTRLGLWDESIASNLDSAASARKLAALRTPGTFAFDELHALDYLEYAYLQTGREAEAARVVETIGKIDKLNESNFQAAFALAAVPARWALERRAWADAAALAPPALTLPWERFSYGLAATHFARAIGGARSGKLEVARGAVAELGTLQKSLAASPPAGPYDWPGHVEALRLAAAGWVARAEGRDAEAVTLLTQAAELDEKMGKHPVTPGAVLPPRELLADLLMELGKPAEALAHYEAALKQAPNRFNGLAGAAQAAAAAGQADKARELQAKLVALGAQATTVRPELERARVAIAGR
jgi:tetratricopeptide (TPR) repeat protein